MKHVIWSPELATRYPFLVSVTPHHTVDMYFWCNEHVDDWKIDHDSNFRFSSESDAVWFALRWVK